MELQNQAFNSSKIEDHIHSPYLNLNVGLLTYINISLELLHIFINSINSANKFQH